MPASGDGKRAGGSAARSAGEGCPDEIAVSPFATRPGYLPHRDSWHPWDYGGCDSSSQKDAWVEWGQQGASGLRPTHSQMREWMGHPSIWVRDDKRRVLRVHGGSELGGE